MALRELPSALRRLTTRGARPATNSITRSCRRFASTEAGAQETSEDFQDLESKSSLLSNGAVDEKVKSYDPIKRSQGRRTQLPASRYVHNGAEGEIARYIY